MNLQAVPNEPTVTFPGLPSFEGKAVEATRVLLYSTNGLDFDNAVLRHDDIVKVVLECRVMDVDHKINQTTGKLERIHKIKPIDGDIVPWNTP